MCMIETNKHSICSGDNIEVTVSESVRLCMIETNKRSICSGDNIEVTVSSQTESVRLSPGTCF